MDITREWCLSCKSVLHATAYIGIDELLSCLDELFGTEAQDLNRSVHIMYDLGDLYDAEALLQAVTTWEPLRRVVFWRVVEAAGCKDAAYIRYVHSIVGRSIASAVDIRADIRQ